MYLVFRQRHNGLCRFARNYHSEASRLASIDLTKPARLYPAARRLHRHIILHIGPTNSGKSYAALQEFMKAPKAYFAGPLRMLAREVFERMKALNVPCNLVTGDEVIEVKDGTKAKAERSSCTMEMMNVSTRMNVAVIDEIQMISDPSRGWAWTRAFLGVQADTVHLCGDISSESIVRRLVKETGDTLTVKRYTRLSPLKIDSALIRKETLVKQLEPGDCIVCFSKRKIKIMRDNIVKASGKRVAVVYGSLPPEVRAEQASLFNDPDSEVNYLVASDAIGLGLNLAIKRVIFLTLSKFDGFEMRKLGVSEIKQIAGRAGRYRVVGQVSTTSTDVESAEGGLVNCVDQGDKLMVAKALKTDSPVVTHAICNVPSEMLLSSAINKSQPFSITLAESLQHASLGDAYKAQSINRAAEVAKVFDLLSSLTFEHKILLSKAPVQDSPEVLMVFYNICKVIESGQCRDVVQIVKEIRMLAYPDVEVTTLEFLHQCISLFLWLSYRFPYNLFDRKGAMDLRDLCESRMGTLLASKRKLAQAEPRRRKASPPVPRARGRVISGEDRPSRRRPRKE